MLIVVPDRGKFVEVKESLARTDLFWIAGGLGMAEVELGLPRFSFESTADLDPILTSLGLGELFDRIAPTSPA
jgi:serine protease inhibitor